MALLLALCVFQLDYSRAVSVQSANEQSRPFVGTPTMGDSKDKPADYSQEAFVIEQIKTLYRYEKDGTYQRELSIRVKVQSDAGVERFGQLIFPYSSANEKLP